MLTLRPFEDKDYPAFVALHNLTHQDSPASIKEVKHFFETRARDIFVNEFKNTLA